MKIIATVLLSISATTCWAENVDSVLKRSAIASKQRKTCIYLEDANFTVIGLRPLFWNQSLIPIWQYGDRIADQFGLSVQHTVSYNLVIGASYNVWNNVSKFNTLSDWIYPDPRYVWGQPGFNDVGALRYRYGYKMVEVYAAYKLNLLGRHKFYLGIGPSYTWGTNYYVTHTWFSTFQNATMVESLPEPGAYFGAIATFRYDLLFWRNRFAIGANAHLRKYFGLYSAQFGYGLHFGVNF